jgi:hypothetical protein
LHKNNALRRLYLGLTGASLMGLFSLPSQASVDVTNKLEFLGNPSKAQYDAQPYARNVWDMQVEGNRIYLGSGNSSNKGPSPNAGPAHIYFLDPTNPKFTDAFITQEEQIERFVRVQNTLYIPGHDPRGSDPAGIYRLGTDDNWVRIAIEGVHVYDLREFNHLAWVGRGIFDYQRDALTSTDLAGLLSNQPSWKYLPIPSLGQTTARLYHFFQIANTLLAAGAPLLGDNQPGFFEYFPALNEWLQISNGKRFFPGALPSVLPKRYTIRRDAVLNRTTLYIGAATYNDHQYYPIGLYRASSLNYIQQIPLESGFLPWDVMVRDGVAYVLSARQDTANQFTIRVQKSVNLRNWDTLLEFTRPSFARSFEFLKGDFYFGMGIEWENESQTSNFTFLGTPEEAGNIYRLRRKSIQWNRQKPSSTLKQRPTTRILHNLLSHCKSVDPKNQTLRKISCPGDS